MMMIMTMMILTLYADNDEDCDDDALRKTDHY